MILITGATGVVGRKLVERLVQANLPVRILTPSVGQPVRGRNRVVAPWPEAVTLAAGSLHRLESLHQAMLGVHTVIHLASAQWWGRTSDLAYVDIDGTANIVTAARSARVGRVMVLSHLGASASSAFTLLRVKGQVEEMIRASGLAYTIFRSGVVFGPDDVFVNGLARILHINPLLFLQPGQGESLLHPLYIDDLVEALYRSLDILNTVDQTLDIGGAEYMTFNEMVRTVMRITRTPRLIASVPPYALRTLSGLFSTVFPHYPITPQWFDLLASNRTAALGNMFDYFGVRPVRFEDTIVKYMRGRRYGVELLRALVQRRGRTA